MPYEIAVLENENGSTASANERARIVVYQRRGCSCTGYSWYPVREREYMPGNLQSIQKLRSRMAEVVDFLGGCRVLVARLISGVPLIELDKSNISVWEVAGTPELFLDDILAAEEEERWQEPAEPIQVVPEPVETSPGCYRISLKEIQLRNSGITSKQVLLPILDRGEYRSLEILCDHVPPWLEARILQGELSGVISRVGSNQTMITITR